LETLIQEGEALVYADAVDAFLNRAKYLLELQRQAEDFRCGQLRNVCPDGALEELIQRYEYREGDKECQKPR
jgi:hypothetical protein